MLNFQGNAHRTPTFFPKILTIRSPPLSKCPGPLGGGQILEYRNARSTVHSLKNQFFSMGKSWILFGIARATRVGGDCADGAVLIGAGHTLRTERSPKSNIH